MWATSYQRDTFHIQIPQKLITDIPAVHPTVKRELSRSDVSLRAVAKPGIRTIKAATRLRMTPKGFKFHAARMSPAQSAAKARVEPHNGHGCPLINLKGQRIGPLAMWSFSQSHRITRTPQISAARRTSNGTADARWIAPTLMCEFSSQVKHHVMLLNDTIDYQVPRIRQGK